MRLAADYRSVTKITDANRPQVHTRQARMSAKAATELVVSGLFLLALFFAGAFLFHSGTTTPSAEVSLGIISGAALAIERSLEVSWSLVDMTKGSWWPLSVVGTQVTERVDAFGAFAQPYFTGLKNAVDDLEVMAADKDAIKAKI